MNSDVFGQAGDFITSPEISQVFGEVHVLQTKYYKVLSNPSDLAFATWFTTLIVRFREQLKMQEFFIDTDMIISRFTPVGALLKNILKLMFLK